MTLHWEYAIGFVLGYAVCFLRYLKVVVEPTKKPGFYKVTGWHVGSDGIKHLEDIPWCDRCQSWHTAAVKCVGV
jgi:hypothetical protein